MGEASVFTIHAGTLYDGDHPDPFRNVLIEVADGWIRSVTAEIDPVSIPSDAIRTPIVTPGLIDLQINGAGDVQFNFELTRRGLDRMVEASARGGATHIFPTFITAPDMAYREAVDLVVAAKRDTPGIAGIHLEGPFLSPERPGIHPSEFIRKLTSDDADYLCQAAEHLKILLTIAPEQQDPDLIRRLCESGVILFAGHSNATLKDMQAAVDLGLRGVTHLFNAMSQCSGRAPGVVGAVLGERSCYAGIIADGYHVHPTNLRMAAQAIPDRLCLVTDAMQTMNGRTRVFDLYGQRITLRGGRLTGDGGTLGGAHLSMVEALNNMTELADVPRGQAVAMASRNPARAVGLDDRLGRLCPGMNASLTFLDHAFECTGIMRDGRYIRFK